MRGKKRWPPADLWPVRQKVRKEILTTEIFYLDDFIKRLFYLIQKWMILKAADLTVLVTADTQSHGLPWITGWAPVEWTPTEGRPWCFPRQGRAVCPVKGRANITLWDPVAKVCCACSKNKGSRPVCSGFVVNLCRVCVRHLMLLTQSVFVSVLNFTWSDCPQTPRHLAVMSGAGEVV